MRFLSFLIVVFVLSSCNINSYIMLKDGKTTTFSEPPVSEYKEYRISPFDQITFRFYKNSGFEILGGSSVDAGVGNTAFQQQQQLALINTYNVEADGKVKLPYVGKVDVSGMTLREAEAYLESRYDSIYVRPFIILNVVNKRVIVSRGNGASQVVPLVNTNVSVFEALSLAGGIDERGKSKKIKLIRRVAGGHEIYKLDLSTVEGLAMADMPVQANDIIYVDPRRQYAGEFLREAAPYVSILTSIVLILTATRTLSN
ncbi:MAG: polysaccharide biosynthesis/export family protein [Bacteroidota bacterium]